MVARSLYTDDHEHLIRLLREIRLEMGVRQAELANRLGRPQSFVSKYETGQRRLDLVELQEISKTLGTSLSTLVARFEASQHAEDDTEPNSTDSP